MDYFDTYFLVVLIEVFTHFTYFMQEGTKKETWTQEYNEMMNIKLKLFVLV